MSVLSDFYASYHFVCHRNLVVSEKKSGFQKIWSQKICPGFHKVCLRKRSWFRYRKIWSQDKNVLASVKKNSRYSVVEGQFQIIGYTICSERKNTITDGGSTVLCCGTEVQVCLYTGFFSYWSALKMTKCQTLRKFWHLKLFRWGLLCNLTLSHFQGQTSPKTTLYILPYG